MFIIYEKYILMPQNLFNYCKHANRSVRLYFELNANIKNANIASVTMLKY